jgi:Domain of unknown function (DUF4440)
MKALAQLASILLLTFLVGYQLAASPMHVSKTGEIGPGAGPKLPKQLNASSNPSSKQAPDVAGVIAQEKRWVAALDDRNKAALEEILADDFIDISWRGAVRRKPDMLAALSAIRTYSNQVSDLKAVVYGGMAIARGINTIRSTNREVARLRFTDAFVYRGAAWIAVSAQETPIVDGDPH